MRFRYVLGLLLVVACSWAGTPARLLVTHVKLFTMAAGQKTPIDGYLVVDETGRIAAVGAGAPLADAWQPAETLDGQGQWMMPGFVSAHSHLWQSAWRGLAADQTLMGWADELYLKRARFAQAEDFYWFALEGALDHVRHGITSTYNFNFAGWNQPEFARWQLKAEMASGIRFVHGQSFGNWDGGGSIEDNVAAAKSFLAWLNQQDTGDQLIGTMINGTAGFSDSAEMTRAEAAMARETGIGNHAHMLESSPYQYEERSHFRWMVDEGFVTDKVLFGHFIHTDPWILAETVKAGAAMSWNPLSNGRLASGTPDIPLYLKMGLRVGMGVDGQASADRADPFENVRMGLYAVRAKYEDATVLSPYQVLRLHTLGSADVLGAADRVGTLEVGKMADFLLIDPTDFGVVFDPYATLAFMAGQEHLKSVYIGGELQSHDGRLTHHDYAAIQAEVNARVRLAGLSAEKAAKTSDN